jgi:hypothetical protein
MALPYSGYLKVMEDMCNVLLSQKNYYESYSRCIIYNNNCAPCFVALYPSISHTHTSKSLTANLIYNDMNDVRFLSILRSIRHLACSIYNREVPHYYYYYYYYNNPVGLQDLLWG